MTTSRKRSPTPPPTTSCPGRALATIWSIWRGLLIVMSAAALASGRLLAYRNNDMQNALWGRAANTGRGATTYNIVKNRVAGVLAILAGVAAIIGRLAGAPL